MEKLIYSDLPPTMEAIYLGALRENGLDVYAKELNLDGWVRSLDVFLVYSEDADLETAREVIEALESGNQG